MHLFIKHPRPKPSIVAGLRFIVSKAVVLWRLAVSHCWNSRLKEVTSQDLHKCIWVLYLVFTQGTITTLTYLMTILLFVYYKVNCKLIQTFSEEVCCFCPPTCIVPCLDYNMGHWQPAWVGAIAKACRSSKWHWNSSLMLYAWFCHVRQRPCVWTGIC